MDAYYSAPLSSWKNTGQNVIPSEFPLPLGNAGNATSTIKFQG